MTTKRLYVYCDCDKCMKELHEGDEVVIIGYYSKDEYFCSKEHAYNALGVKEINKSRRDEACEVCGELLDAENYEAYEAEGEKFCCLDCLDERFGIKYVDIER